MTRPSVFRSAGLLAAAAILVAACGGAASSGAPATGTPATQAPATQAPLGSVGPEFSFALPSEAKDLEDIIPDEIAGETVVKSSMSGASIGAGSEDIQGMLGKLGKSTADLSAAFGGNSKASLVIFRVAGVDSNTLFNAFLEAAEPDDVAQISDVNVAGKSAKKVVDAAGVTTSYIYLRGDTLITVTTMAGDLDAQVLDEIFQQLP